MDTLISTNSTAGTNKLYQANGVESLGAMEKACNQEPKLMGAGEQTQKNTSPKPHTYSIHHSLGTSSLEV